MTVQQAIIKLQHLPGGDEFDPAKLGGGEKVMTEGQSKEVIRPKKSVIRSNPKPAAEAGE